MFRHLSSFACVLVVASSLAGCQAILNKRFPPGEMDASGSVYPCNDRRTNPQACGEAIYNAPRVRQLNLGMDLATARRVMGRDPEERGLKVVDSTQVETWGYLTDYDNTIVSTVTFTNGRISSIESSRR